MSNVSLIDGHLDNAEHCVCCGQVIPEGRQACVICGYKADNGKQTNYDRIRNMSVEELARFMDNLDGSSCEYCIGECSQVSCKDGFINWLEAEVTE